MEKVIFKKITKEAEHLLDKMELSLREIVLPLANAIADINEHDNIELKDVIEADNLINMYIELYVNKKDINVGNYVESASESYVNRLKKISEQLKNYSYDMPKRKHLINIIDSLYNFYFSLKKIKFYKEVNRFSDTIELLLKNMDMTAKEIERLEMLLYYVKNHSN